MYTFSQLLVRNAIFGVLFSVVTSIIVAVSFSQYLAKQQSNHQTTLTAIAQQVVLQQDVKAFSNILKKLPSYQLLIVTDTNGNQLYHFKNQENGWLAQQLTPPPTQINLPELGININAQISSSNDADLALHIILLLLLGITLFVFIASFASTKRYKSFFVAINQQIKKDLSLVLPEDNQQELDTHAELFEMPELKSGMLEIKDLLEQQQQDTVSLEKQAYVDSLTGLANRNQFIKHFEQKFNQPDKKAFGVLAITRCSELQTINQVRGYHEGDKYIKQVADIMKNEVSRYKGGLLYRLNSSDFASLLPNTTLKNAEQYSQELTLKFNDFQHASDLDSVAYSGLVAFDEQKPLGEILALADTGISIAQTQSVKRLVLTKR